MTGSRWVRAMPIVWGALALAACDGDGRPSPDRVSVFAATSFAPALEEIFVAQRARTGNRPRVTYGTDAALAKQIDEGADADLFVCSNPLWTQWLDSRGRLDPSGEVVLVEDRLVIVATPGRDWTFDPAEGRPLADAFVGRIALGDPERVSSGGYAKEALEHAGWWADLYFRVLPGNDAHAVLRSVERGDAQVGIVYASDLSDDGGVRVVASIPEPWHAAIRYPLAPIAGRRRPAVDRCVAFLTSEECAEVFRRHGFRVPERSVASPGG